MHEAQTSGQSCFVTLTYDDAHLPSDGSLVHRHFQLFMKRLRKRFHPHNIRFYMSGEYGPLNLRPHYHACIFGTNFLSDRIRAGTSASGAVYFESRELSTLWGMGRASVQDLTIETAGYCARYIMSKVTGDLAESHYESTDADGVITRRRPEYNAMSLRPGIGFAWFSKYGRDVYPHDFVVAGGVTKRPPKFYDKLKKRVDPLGLEPITHARELRGRAAHADNTDERRRVREQVNQARIRNQKRDL